MSKISSIAHFIGRVSSEVDGAQTSTDYQPSSSSPRVLPTELTIPFIYGYHLCRCHFTLAMLQYSHVWTLRSVIKERLKNETLLSKKNL